MPVLGQIKNASSSTLFQSKGEANLETLFIHLNRKTHHRLFFNLWQYFNESIKCKADSST